MTDKAKSQLKGLIEVASGKQDADLIIRGGKIVNVFTNEIIEGEIAVFDGLIAGIGQNYKSQNIINISGKYIAPGFIDGHVHIESTMVTPEQFANAVVPRGTTTVIADPHEIANVCGLAGIKYMMTRSENLPLDIFYMMPSCVPATIFETSGACISASDMQEMIDYENVLGLGEIMNYPDVCLATEDVLDKLIISKGKIKDGHAPRVSGKLLNAYIASGIRTEHECSTVEEMQEKLRLGMYVQIREGSAAKNLEVLIKGVNKDNISRCIFCTDDRHLEDILIGHIDNNIRLAVKNGIKPIDAIRMATLNTAECYGLKNKGAIAPGYCADMIVLDNLEELNVYEVFKNGELVAQNGVILKERKPIVSDSAVLNTVRFLEVTEDKLKIQLKDVYANVISILPNSIENKRVLRRVSVRDNLFQFGEDGINKIVVVERHKNTGNVGVGLIENYGIKNGAIASTIAHDSHNLIVVGDNDEDILLAIAELRKSGGGLTIASKGKVLKTLELPIAGIMTDRPYKEVLGELQEMISIAYGLGINKDIDPFITLSFQALPVIPEIRLTDMGLFDVTKFSFIEN